MILPDEIIVLSNSDFLTMVARINATGAAPDLPGALTALGVRKKNFISTSITNTAISIITFFIFILIIF
jgi:hypothetical protein